ncbi:MAG TPA: GNAT family N-acetyltransferase [Candidatus Microsaccharimonas sp.]|jgi:ribosomal protein S18 acetylase RimI-like enzyme
MLDFTFTNTPGGRNQDAISERLVQPRLWIPQGDYPAHLDWREKAIAQIAEEKKRAMIAFWGSDAVGSVVYQQDPKDPSTVEIRNLSVEPYARGRHVASFLLNQTEHEAAVEFPDATRIVTDTKQTNAGLIAFALHNGYKIKIVTTLDESAFAHNGVQDVVLTKSLSSLRS